MTLALGAIAPLYSGFTFNSGFEALTGIRDYLVQKLWTVVDDRIVANATITLMGMTDNGHTCFIKLSVINSPTRNYIQLQGDLDGTGTYLSDPLELDFDLGYVNRLWCFADGDSGGVCIRNRYVYSGAFSFGFLERFDDSDQYAWMVALANNRLNDAYVARAKHNDAVWHRIGDSYYNADQFASTAMNGAHQGIVDFATAIAFGAFTALSIANAAYYAQEGRINGVNGMSLITRRWYIEGIGNPSGYTRDTKFYCRGFIKHFYNGFGEIPGGGIFDDEAGNKYLSTGSGGWQGLKILHNAEPEINNSLPVIYHGGESGITVSNGEQLISEIRNVLTNLDWEIKQDSVDSSNNRSLILRGEYFATQEYCYLNLGYVAATNTIQIRGEVRENDAVSGDKSKIFSFVNVEKLWITANNQAGAIILDDNAVYFGFYGGRINNGDSYAWGIGKVTSDLRELLVAKSFLTGETWESIGDQFDYATNRRSSFPVYGTSDRLTVPLIPFDYYDFEDSRNSALDADKGRINGATNLPQLDFFAVVEGRDNKFDYGASEQFVQQPKTLYYRGFIQFLSVGMAALEPGTTARSSTGAKFVKVNDSRGQGVQIG